MKAQRVTVGTTKTLIHDGTHGSVTHKASALIKNPTGGQAVYLGGEDVNTSTTGFPLASGEIASVDVINDVVFGIVAATTQDVYVLHREL